MKNEIISFSNDYQNICLMGDFNSRTSTEKDFVDPADFGLQDVDMFYHDVQELPNFGFLMERNSKDTTVNNLFIIRTCL